MVSSVATGCPVSSRCRDHRLATVTCAPSRLVWTSSPSQRPVRSSAAANTTFGAIGVKCWIYKDVAAPLRKQPVATETTAPIAEIAPQPELAAVLAEPQVEVQVATPEPEIAAPATTPAPRRTRATTTAAPKPEAKPARAKTATAAPKAKDEPKAKAETKAKAAPKAKAETKAPAKKATTTKKAKS